MTPSRDTYTPAAIFLIVVSSTPRHRWRSRAVWWSVVVLSLAVGSPHLLASADLRTAGPSCLCGLGELVREPVLPGLVGRGAILLILPLPKHVVVDHHP